jgi:hypothetical protein
MDATMNPISQVAIETKLADVFSETQRPEGEAQNDEAVNGDEQNGEG